MTQQERLAICELCENKIFSPKLGVICSLNSERPAFEGSCEDFSEDKKMVVRKERLAESRKNLSNGGGGDLVEVDGESSSPWKIVLTVVVVILVLLKWLIRCDRVMN